MKQAKGKESTKDRKAAKAYQNRARAGKFGKDGAGHKSMMDKSYMQLRRRPQRCSIEHESIFTKLAESATPRESITWY